MTKLCKREVEACKVPLWRTPKHGRYSCTRVLCSAALHARTQGLVWCCMQVSVRNARHSGLQSLKDIASEDERFRAETEVGVLQAHALHIGSKGHSQTTYYIHKFLPIPDHSVSCATAAEAHGQTHTASRAARSRQGQGYPNSMKAAYRANWLRVWHTGRCTQREAARHPC